MSPNRWLIVLLVFVACGTVANAQDVIFVANRGVQISGIKVSDLRAIFMGEKTRFADGSHAVPVIRKGGPAHEVFVKNYFDESPNDFREQWRKEVFTGQGSMPKSFDSESALIEYVSATPGTIGYVSRIGPEANVKSLTLLK
jgi:ABC-type phosphate transport system substrate-binding protein